MFTRRILCGVIVTWTLLEGTRTIWKMWAAHAAATGTGLRKTLADDVQLVVS